MGVVALGVAAVAFSWWRVTHGGGDIALLHPPLPVHEWSDYVARLASTPLPAVPEIASLRAATVRRNRAEAQALGVGVSPPDDPVYRAAAQAWQQAADRFVQLHGTAAMLQVGRFEGLRLAEALPPVLARARTDAERDGLLVAESPSPDVQACIDLGGGFLHFVGRGGFLDDRGALREDLRPLLQAVFLGHWGAPLKPRHNLDPQWHTAERAWLSRWKVEWQTDGSLESRVAAADQLRAAAEYPADLNAGVLLFEAGHIDAAMERFGRSTAPEAARYLRIAEKARAAR